MSLSTAINIFLRKSLMVGGLPFDVSMEPNCETLAALIEADELLQNPKSKRHTFDEAMKELDK